MRVRLRPSIRATAIALIAAPSLAAQQWGGGVLHTPDPSQRVTLFPRSIGYGAVTAPSRFQILAQAIDSAATIGGRMQRAAATREQAAQMSSRILLLSQVAHGFDRRMGRTQGGMDWISAVTVAGVSQLAQTSLFATSESGGGPSIWRSIRSDGQFAGLATITGGASWLLSNLALHATRFGVPHSHITAGATHSH